MSKVRKSLLLAAVLLFLTAVCAFFTFNYNTKTVSADTSSDAHTSAYGGAASHTGTALGSSYTGGALMNNIKYYLTDDVTLTTNITVTGTVHLCLNGHKITGTGTGSVITVNRDATFYLHDCQNKGCITNGNAQNGGGVYVDGGESLSNHSNALFVMYGGTINGNEVTGSSSNGNGGGVYVRFGTFEMNGGTISGNKATGNGGGVYITGATSIFTMNGGTISGNHSTEKHYSYSYGGGVDIGAGTFNLSGSVDISGNTRSDRNVPADIYLNGTNKINITGNLNLPEGKQIYVLCKNAGEITDNQAGAALSADNFASGQPHKFNCVAKLSNGNIFIGTHPYDNAGVCTLCRHNEPRVEVILNNTVTSYHYRIDEAYEAVKTLETSENVWATIALLADITFKESETLEFNYSTGNYLNYKYAYVILDLCGYSITVDSVIKSDIIKLSNGFLQLNDSSEGATGMINGNFAANGCVVASSGYSSETKFIMNGGTICGFSGSGSPSACMSVSGNNCTFTMNGGTICGNSCSAVSVSSAGTFTMNDGTIGGDTEEAANTAGSNNGGGVYVTYGTFIMNGGAIKGNKANAGGGVNSNNSSFTMYGGTISGNEATSTGAYAGGGGVFVSGGTFTMSVGENDSVGTIEENKAYYGGGVYVYGGGTFNMNCGEIRKNNVTGYGGGVLTAYSGTFNLTAGEKGKTGTVSGNTATAIDRGNNNYEGGIGGGVCVYQSGKFEMNGGTIGGDTEEAANEAVNGGGVAVYQGTSSIMNGGTISGNKATGNGGGVYVDRGSFTMKDGTIGGDTANKAVNGGGVYIDQNGTFTLSGGTVSGNTLSGNSTKNNVYLIDGKAITINSGLATGTWIGITLADGYSGEVFTSGYGANNKDSGANVVNPSKYFFSDAGKCVVLSEAETTKDEVKLGGLHEEDGPWQVGEGENEGYHVKICSYCGGIIAKEKHDYTGGATEGICETCGAEAFFKVTVDETDTYYHTLLRAFEVANNAGRATITMLADAEAQNATLTVNSGNDITLDLNGKIVTGSGKGSVITVNGVFTLTDGSTDHNGIITGGSAYNGGGVYVTENAAFKMEKGTISKNKASSYGGGVYVTGSNSTFTMSGGTISGNQTDGYGRGGGVYVTYGTFTMSGGTISGNQNDRYGRGGGVYVTYGTFTMSGGTISRNHSGSLGNGGGVYVTGSNSTFTMSGGTISVNTAIDYGGGVFVSESASFEMKKDENDPDSTGGIICGNGVSGRGGGVFVTGDNSVFTMSAGTIGGDSAEDANTGSGVDVANGGTFTMSGGKISGNKSVGSNNSSGAGGGVNVAGGGKFTMNGGQIIENEVTGSGTGGGVQVYGSNSTFTMSAGTISGNKAPNTGGGVNVANGGTFTMNGGSVKANKADTGGGVYIAAGSALADPGAFILSDGEISGNTNLGGRNSNVQLNGSITITINEGLKTGTWIGVTLAGSYSNDVFTSGYGANNKDSNNDDEVINPSEYFFADNGMGVVLKSINDSFEVMLGELHTHNITHTGYKAKTCTEDGNIEHWHCSDCDTYFTNEACTQVINKEGVVIHAGHELKPVTAKDATCTEIGIKKACWQCTVCNKYSVDDDKTTVITDESEVVIPKLDHKKADGTSAWVFDNTIQGYVAATCEEGGVDTYECSLCHVTKQELTAVRAHDGEHIDAELAACTEKGNYAYFQCTRGCGLYYYDENGYDEDEHTDGVYEKSTSEFSDVEIDATGHKYKNDEGKLSVPVIWTWTGHDSATATFTCNVCGATHDETANIQKGVTANPTCNENGNTPYTATATFEGVHTNTKTETIPKFAHNWTVNWSEWTKADSGEWTVTVSFTCNAMNPVLHTENPTGVVVAHSTTKAPDCIHKGTETYTASIVFDGGTYNAPDKMIDIAPTGVHSWTTEYTVDKPATCTETGSKYTRCTADGCDEKGNITEIPVTGHAWTVTVTDETKKTYTAFDKFDLNGLVATFTCDNDSSHQETFTGGTSTVLIRYVSGNCLHYGDTLVTVEITLTGYDRYTYDYEITGLTVAKLEVTAGGANWRSGGSELMNGSVKEEDGNYKYYPAGTSGATDVTNAIVRYVSGTVTVYYPEGALYSVQCTGNTADASGMYTATATLTLADSVNYVFVAAGGATLNADGTVTVDKEWYAAICDNGFNGSIAGWTFGSTPSALPELEHDDGQDGTVSFLLVRNGEQIGGAFNRGNYPQYINRTTPVGEYTLTATVSNVTINSIEYAGFEQSFTFTVSEATFTAAGLGDIYTVYDGNLHIERKFTPPAAVITAGTGVWENYADLYGNTAVTYSHANWNGNYYTKAQIAAMAGNKLFINAGRHTAQYKISVTNYRDITGSFVVEIDKADYIIRFFPDDKFTYDGEPHSLEVRGPIPEGVTIKYDNNGQTNAGTYTVTAMFTGDYENYNVIEDMTATLIIERVKISLNLTFDDSTVPYDGNQHRIILVGGGDLPEQVDVVYSSNSGVQRGTYNATAAVSIKTIYEGNYEFAQGTKTYYEATLTITLGIIDMSGVHFEPKTVIYTGNAYSLSITGTLPAGVTYSYENNECVDADIYEVKVHFYHSNPDYDAIKDMEATLTINKADYNMNNVRFPSATVAYTGNAHSLSIRGKLPAGVTYTYDEHNSLTDVGSQLVTVKFTGDSKNYNPIRDMEATLTVIPASFGLKDVSLEGMTVEYDGNTHRLSVKGALPEGVEVKYYVTVDNQEVEFKGATDAGIYDVTAKFVIPDSVNYKAIRPLTARLKIVAAEQGEGPIENIEPTVGEIKPPEVGNNDYNIYANTVLGGPVQKKGFYGWIIAACVIAAELAVVAGIGGYLAFGSFKRKKR